MALSPKSNNTIKSCSSNKRLKRRISLSMHHIYLRFWIKTTAYFNKSNSIFIHSWNHTKPHFHVNKTNTSRTETLTIFHTVAKISAERENLLSTGLVKLRTTVLMSLKLYLKHKMLPLKKRSIVLISSSISKSIKPFKPR